MGFPWISLLGHPRILAVNIDTNNMMPMFLFYSRVECLRWMEILETMH